MNLSTNPARKIVTFGFTLIALISATFAQAQSYNFGKNVEVAYEGWRPLEDGSFNFMFGYMNENWEEEPDVHIGENNFFSPGDADRGQPTHFLPRRNRFTFEVNVPSDWGDRELVWELTVNGVTRRAYATLKDDYLVDNMVIASETGSLGAGTSSPESRANVAPVVTLQGDTVNGEHVRSVRVGEPLSFTTHLMDDGVPRARRSVDTIRAIAARGGESTTEEMVQRQMAMRIPWQPTVGKINGLFLSWNVYRGAGKVTFDPPQPKPWEDTRPGSNSAWGLSWSPPEIAEDGMINTTVSFEEPGEYVLWGRGDDGGLYHDAFMTVTVTQ
ncbi:MAG: hypothetical protein O3C29_12780 [Proteobacteria bacterium]|jgi:hypothetical protein|nr:hypothetical protein [Pseudomonadota bacterium]MDA1290166.1 hypothetical protein [Pseudomonadota bacterium]